VERRRGLVPPVRRDADVTLPLLDEAARGRLRETVGRIVPGHVWLDML
jgi:hypothetical protein